MLQGALSLVSPFNQLRREMDRLLDDFGLGVARVPYRRYAATPPLNAWDTGNTFCVEAEVPGVVKEDLEVYAVGNELTIKGRRRPMEGEDLTYHRRERGSGEFTRVITLPVELDADKVEAVLKDGVLTVHCPKAEAVRPRQISVKTGR